jgi:surface antigen
MRRSEGSVETRLTQLRDAADIFDQCAGGLEEAVNETNVIISGLMAMGFKSPAATVFQTEYQRQSGVMQKWPEQLTVFARKLREAVQDVEAGQRAQDGVIRDPGKIDDPGSIDGGTGENGGNGHPHDDGHPGQGPDNSGPPGHSGDSGGGPPGQSSGTGTTGGTSGGVIPPVPVPTGGGTSSKPKSETGSSSGEGTDESASDSSSSEPPAPADPDMPSYLSGKNAALYQELTTTKTAIAETETRLAEWTATRDERVRYLEDLKARHAASARPNPAVAETIAALESEIGELDRRIVGAQGELGDLQDKADGLRQRLQIVAPGPNADLDAIRRMEGKIAGPIKDEYSDVGCVRYVMDRMPIPPEIARNAHQWDDDPAKLAKFGIKVGSEPMTGSVIVMEPEHKFGHDVYGHVMYVERVDPNGDIWVTDNNFPGSPRRLQDLTDELSGPNIKYMYFPWETRA